MLVTKRCNICGGIINADEDIFSITIKQINGTKPPIQLESMLICKFCMKDIVKKMRELGSGACSNVYPGIPER